MLQLPELGGRGRRCLPQLPGVERFYLLRDEPFNFRDQHVPHLLT
jgi:hypothetical protein